MTTLNKIDTNKPTQLADRFISFYNNSKSTSPSGAITIADFISMVKDDTFKALIEEGRAIQHPEEFKQFKRQKLPAVSLSTLAKTREKNAIDPVVYHTDLLQIDVDSVENVDNIKNILLLDPYVVFAFTSPSNRGVKAAIRIDGNKHKEYFKYAQTYFLKKYNLTIDKQVNDINRLCFVSHDPEAYVNFDAQILPPILEKENKPIAKTVEPIHLSDGSVFEFLTGYIEKNSYAGNLHYTRLVAGQLAGGYYAAGLVNDAEVEALINHVQSISKEPDIARKTFIDGFDWGKAKPITNAFNKVKNSAFMVDKSTGEIFEIPFCFWYEYKKGDAAPILRINQMELLNFVYSLGFRRLSVDNNEPALVQVINSVVALSSIDTLRHVVIDKISRLEFDLISDNFSKIDLLNLLIKGIDTYLSNAKINAFIGEELFDFVSDTKDETVLFFQNCMVIATKDGIETRDYSQLNGVVWDDDIINHQFIPVEDAKVLKSFNFARWIDCLATDKADNKLDINRRNAIWAVIGFFLHTYKNPSNNKAVIFTEAVVSAEPKGQAGKGLLMNSIGKLRKVTTIDGKNFNFDSSFALQQIELNTKIAFFDDVVKYFPFDKTFSMITEGIAFEKKGQNRVKLSVVDSPKICISTNYGIQDESQSAKARKYEMELLPYFDAEYTPFDLFEEYFFDSWDVNSWNVFYNFMVTCAAFWHINNQKFIKYQSQTMVDKKLLAKTSADFIEFIKTVDYDVEIPMNLLYSDYLELSNSTEKELPKQKFGRWLIYFADLKNVRLEKTQQKIDGKNTKHYTFKRL